MPWKRLFIIAPLTLCVAFSVSCAGGKSAQRPQDRVAAQEKSVEARLGESEARIEVLEKRLNALERRVAVRTPEETAQQREARVKLNEIVQLAGAGELDQAKVLMEEFQKTYGNTIAGRRGEGLSRELAVVGKEVPAQITIEKWLAGKAEVDLSSEHPTLLVFWEVWCPHCRHAMPELEHLYETYRPKGLRMVGLTRITGKATEQAVLAFIDENKLTYPIAKEDGNVSQEFAVTGIPAAALVKGGKIVWRGHPERLSEEVLMRWL